MIRGGTARLALSWKARGDLRVGQVGRYTAVARTTRTFWQTRHLASRTRFSTLRFYPRYYLSSIVACLMSIARTEDSCVTGNFLGVNVHKSWREKSSKMIRSQLTPPFTSNVTSNKCGMIVRNMHIVKHKADAPDSGRETDVLGACQVVQNNLGLGLDGHIVLRSGEDSVRGDKVHL